jgi:lactoylglutathione lyase
MIRVQDLGRSLAFYESAFGFEIRHQLDLDDFSLVYLGNKDSEMEIELTWNRGKSEPYTHGDGYGHVAFVVPDVGKERDRLISLGIHPNDLREFRTADGSLLARYFFIQDPDGYKIEVIEKGGHYR